MKKPKYFSPTTEAEFTDLHSSCWQCSPDGVRRCLNEGFDPNARDKRGWTPLIWLVRMHDEHDEDRKQMFRWLIEAGADIELKAHSGHNIVELAEDCCSPSFFEFVKAEYERLTNASNQPGKSRS